VRGLIRTLTPIAIPLLSNSLGRANVLGLTIDLRGYRTAKQTSLRDRSLRGLDFAAMTVLLAASALFAGLSTVGLVA
jgi:energy-coupling factor transport system permease protein